MRALKSMLGILCLVMLMTALFTPQALYGYSANKVFLETMEDGRYRVAIIYTVPALKEFRRAHAIFNNKKEADTLYWQLLRGAEFSVNGPANIRFPPAKLAPEPW